MAGKPFDATLKELIEADPPSWARFAMGRPVNAVALVDAEASTLTAAADKVMRVETDDGPLLVNVEAEARPAGDAPAVCCSTAW